jgi:outer membrane protein OmpA-like peptidoglycan-associated protein
VIFSDGKPTAPGGWRAVPDETLEAARAVANARDGRLCIYTVQTSDDPVGSEFLQTLSQVTDCGGFRRADNLGDIASLHSFGRQIFIGDQLPAVAARRASRDSDGDGVVDPADQCPNTLPGVAVGDDGCWGSEGVRFDFDSADVTAQYETELNAIGELLSRHPGARLTIEGHTDSIGDVDYNAALSERRAVSAERYLEALGIDAKRIEVRGLGEADPLLPNTSRANRAVNRRVEFSVVSE